MSRFVNGLFEGPARAGQSWIPALDVWETEYELVYALDLPGVPEEKISIEVNDDTLTVSAKRENVAEASSDGLAKPRRIQLGSSKPEVEGTATKA
jgi:HSP20 family protein